MSDLYAATSALAAFLNHHNGNDRPEMSMQMLKLTEECGEAAAAWIGYTGQNPRKGVTHTVEDVLAELADVVITALVGIERIGGDAREVVGRKVDVMARRYSDLEARA